MLHAIPCTTIPASNTTLPTPAELHLALIEKRACIEDRLIICKATGEILGSFTNHNYAPSPYDYPSPRGAHERPSYSILEDGSPIELFSVNESGSMGQAKILQFPGRTSGASSKSNAGRKPSVIINPIAGFLQQLQIEGYPAAWIDDFVTGAAAIEVECEGSDTATTGLFNVAPSDVRRVLCLYEISTDAAIDILCNHNLQPMSSRQIERVVKAARIALGGVMMHLETHQELLQQLDYTIDFSSFWRARNAQTNGGSAEQSKAVTLHSQGWSITNIAKEIGIHRNTVSRWLRESAVA